VYFFDNNFSRQIVNILKELGVDACHLTEHMAASTPDEEWMPKVAAEGWTAVTTDYRIYKNAAQRSVLIGQNLKTVFFPSGYVNRPRWDQAIFVVKHWQSIQKGVEHENYLLLRVNDNGKVERLPLR
jgi:predicted nuclease of predicted toxin-antitoxin system